MTRILCIGEAFGKDEDIVKRPFVGASGRLLNRLFEEANLIPAGSAQAISPSYTNFLSHKRDEIYERSSIYLTNVLNLHPPGNKIEALCGERWGTLPPIRPGKYLRPEHAHHLERLDSEIRTHKPNLIIGLGATSVWYMLGTSSIAKLRGAVAPSRHGKFLPTYHPAFLLRGAWNLRPVVLFDLIKANYEADFPEVRRPKRFVYIPESFQDIEWALREMADAECISIDIETVGNQITCIGFAWTKEHSLVIPIFDWRNDDRSYWGANEESQVWRYIRQLCELSAPKLFQNGLYDIRFLWERYGIMPRNCRDDTMLLHHTLQPEVQKGLGFLGSIYTAEPAWKLMRSKGKAQTIKREDE